ncbi:IS110 family transposase [Streptomyces sp. NPDC059153]|uniref:IS110 family transposase n=1 Tax=Streptomyces sp. NPDC059153 TaxID=3346743 RepID=UPI00367EC3D9
MIDTEGTKVLSRRVPNNEAELLELMGDVLALAEDDQVTWAVDLNAGGAVLLIALLASHGQRLLHIPGRTVHHASLSYRGNGKTDAKDAYVIADQARMRRDLQYSQDWDEIAVDLKILTARRYVLAADRTRVINRLRAQLLEYFPLGAGVRLRRLQGRRDPADRLSDAGCPAPDRPEPAGDLVEEPRSPLRSGPAGRGSCRCAGPAHSCRRGGHDRGLGQHPGQDRAGVGRGDRQHRPEDRGPVP